MRASSVVAAALALTASCGDGASDTAPRSPSSADLGGDVVARVGGATVTVDTVRRVASAQSVANAEARARAVRDALFAEEARARGVDVARLEGPVLARTLLEVIRREAAGPVTDEELEDVTRRHWSELRRPESVRVVHAVVRAKPRPGRPPSEDQLTRASAVATSIHEAVRGATELARARPVPPGDPGDDPAVAEFRRLASGVDDGGLEVRVEVLDPFTADGRVVGGRGGTFAQEFVDAAFPLEGRGAVSAPFRSPFGSHVAMLLERVPPLEIPADERRRLVADEVLDDRIRARRTSLLEERRAQVQIAPNAAALLDLVRVQ